MASSDTIPFSFIESVIVSHRQVQNITADVKQRTFIIFNESFFLVPKQTNLLRKSKQPKVQTAKMKN